MRFTRFSLLSVVCVFVVASGSATMSGESRAQDSTSVHLPEFTIPISTRVKIKDLNNPLSLNLTVATRMQIIDNRASFSFRLNHPELYDKIIEALRSRDGTGCSVVWDGPGPLEVKLCRIHWFDAVWDNKSSSVWIRGNARLRRLARGIAGDTYNQHFTLEASIEAKRDSIQLRGRSVNLRHVPGEVDRRIARGLGSEFPLPRCLHNRNLRIEGFSFRRNANVIEFKVSLPSQAIADVMVKCVPNP